MYILRSLSQNLQLKLLHSFTSLIFPNSANKQFAIASQNNNREGDYIVVSPEHALVEKLNLKSNNDIKVYCDNANKKSELQTALKGYYYFIQSDSNVIPYNSLNNNLAHSYAHNYTL